MCNTGNQTEDIKIIISVKKCVIFGEEMDRRLIIWSYTYKIVKVTKILTVDMLCKIFSLCGLFAISQIFYNEVITSVIIKIFLNINITYILSLTLRWKHNTVQKAKKNELLNNYINYHKFCLTISTVIYSMEIILPTKSLMSQHLILSLVQCITLPTVVLKTLMVNNVSSVHT